MPSRRRISSASALVACPDLADEDQENVDVNSQRSTAKESERDGPKSARRGRRSIGSSRRRSFGTPLAAPLAVESQPQSEEAQEQIQNMYDKIHTILQLSLENKINTKNAWNLGVNVSSIMDSALEEGGDEASGKPSKSVNFQKASCKLDASVKIYSVRVDDTHQASYRILENLTRSKGANDQGNDAPQGNAVVGEKSTSNKFCVANTLEKNVKNLNMNSMEENVSVDPSFHKMSKLFDEDGARGMLLANLSLCSGGGCRVQFGDFKLDEEESEEDPALDMKVLNSRVQQSSGGEDLTSLPLCDELAMLRSDIAELTGKQEGAAGAARRGRGATGGDDGSDDDDGHADCGMYDDYGAGDDFDDDNGDNEWNIDALENDCLNPNNTTDTMLSPCDSSAAASSGGASGRSQNILDALCSDQMIENDYAFFDMKRLEAMNVWAGAKHWKFGKSRAPAPQKKAATLAEEPEGGGAEGDVAKKGKRGRAELAIDFSKDWDADAVASTLAEPKGRNAKTSTQLTVAAIKRSEDAHAASAHGGVYSLPDDACFNVNDLARLFLRPDAVVRRGVGNSSNGNGSGFSFASSPALTSLRGGNQEDDSFVGAWGAGAGGDDLDDSFGFDDNERMDVPFGDDSHMDGSAHGEDDGVDVDVSKLLAPVRRVDKIRVHHETRAKRVDVRQLKTQIWDEIGKLETPTDVDNEEGTGSEEKASTSPLEKDDMAFSDVMTRVHDNQDQKGVTLPFYFICVLHLANEKGLKLTGNEDMSDFHISM